MNWEVFFCLQQVFNMLLLETFNMELLEVSSAALFCLICCHQVSNDWLIDWLYRYIFYLVWSDWYNDLSHSFLFSFLVIFQELTDCSANESIGLFDHHHGINPSLNSDDIIQLELIDSVIDTLIACVCTKGVWYCHLLPLITDHTDVWYNNLFYFCI